MNDRWILNIVVNDNVFWFIFSDKIVLTFCNFVIDGMKTDGSGLLCNVL